MTLHTSLRGYGACKRNLLNALLQEYGRAGFLVRDAGNIPGFTRGVFRRLVLDGLLVPATGTVPCRWRITTALVSATHGDPTRQGDRGALTVPAGGRP